MDSVAVRTKLVEVLASVLEDTAFVFSEEADPPVEWAVDPADPEALVSVAMGFEGQGSGTLVLASTHAFGAYLAANLLGVDEDDPTVSDQGKGAMSELLNVVGGVLLSELYGDDAPATLGLPRAESTPSTDYERARSEWTHTVSVVADDEHRVDLSVRMD